MSEEFGISDVAIAKRCKKLNIPRPSRGYWAKLEAGKRLPRPSLPPTPQEVFIKEATKPIGENLTLVESTRLHPLAAEYLKEARSARLSQDEKRVHLRVRAVPEADISRDIAVRASGAFHVLLQIVEPRGIQFRRSQSSYDGGHFRKGDDYLYLKIEEELMVKPEAAGRRRTFRAQWQENKVPCGKLTFSFQTERYSRIKPKVWTESEKTPLEAILAEMARFICDHYVEVQMKREAEAVERETQRVESEQRHQEYLREEAIRKKQEMEEKHVKSLESAAQGRRADLAKAAEWWRLYLSVSDFISECERHWGGGQEVEFTVEQKDWLTWARKTARELSPFEAGYPDPHADGGFDPTAVPFNGPYPEIRNFPQPPTMPEIPPAVTVK